MKFSDILSILLMEGLIIVFVVVVTYQPKSAGAQVSTPAKISVLQTKEINNPIPIPSQCEKFYEKAEDIITNRGIIYEQANAIRSIANSLMYQNCVARNGK